MNGKRASVRPFSGAVLPVVVFCLAVCIAFLVLTVDVMRTVHAASILDFSSQATALAGLSYACDPDGNFQRANAENNIRNAVLASGDNEWNSAPSGPNGPTSKSAVRFEATDISFVDNSSGNAADFALRVRARRDGADQIKLFFAPAIFAFGGAPQGGVASASPYRIAEVISQPASRIGAGPSRLSTEPHAIELKGWAAFPLAISNIQFAQAASPTQTNQNYVIDIFGSQDTGYTAVAPANHIKGCFVNLLRTNGQFYYGEAASKPDFDQLFHSLEYFFAADLASAAAPAAIERGVGLAAFDPSSPVWQERLPELSNRLAGLVRNKFYILPVLSQDPNFSQRQTVTGFARFKLLDVQNTAAGIKLVMQIGDSVPVRNASFANGLASIPTVDGRLIAAPVLPFKQRTLDTAGGSFSALSRGIAMAPSLSPRQITD